MNGQTTDGQSEGPRANFRAGDFVKSGGNPAGKLRSDIKEYLETGEEIVGVCENCPAPAYKQDGAEFCSSCNAEVVYCKCKAVIITPYESYAIRQAIDVTLEENREPLAQVRTAMKKVSGKMVRAFPS